MVLSSVVPHFINQLVRLYLCELSGGTFTRSFNMTTDSTVNFDDDDDIGLSDEDKGKVHSNQIDWYKGEKGRTDRVALVYFNTHEITQLRKAVKAKPDLTDDQKKALITTVRAKIAEKNGKTVDQLDLVDLLDTSEARFKKVTGCYKKGLGFIAWPKSPTNDELKVWSKLGEKKDYLTALLLIYPTDREGEIDKDNLAKRWSLKPWRFSPDKYEVIRKTNRGLLESGSTIAAIDLNISCTDTEYQKITITQAGPALYARNEKFRRMILEKAVTLYDKLNPFREMSTDELREKLGIAGVGGAAVSPGSDLSGEDFTNILGNV